MSDKNFEPVKVKANGNVAREEKKRKWEAKQQQKDIFNKRKRQREHWCEEHYHCVTYVTEDFTTQASADGNLPEVPALLQPYLNLREGSQLQGGDTEPAAYFIAEGTETIRLLIRQSMENGPLKINVKSIFVKPSLLFDEPVNLLRDLEHISSQSSALTEKSGNAFRLPFHVFVAEEQIMSNIAGFHIARGALACGDVPPNRDKEWLLNYLHQIQKDDAARPIRLLACDGISDTANLGSMIRNSSAFGITAVVLSKDCCDCWYRRAVRVSMGHVFRVPCIRVDDLALLLKNLMKSSLGIISYAAVIDPASDLLLENIVKGSVGKAWCCVMGNESKGISGRVRSACSHSVRIEMEADVDSLSVPVATGILLHGLKERE